MQKASLKKLEEALEGKEGKPLMIGFLDEICQKQGIILVYLPPYSPTLNPIEFLWKDVKKKLSQYVREPLDNLKLQGAAIAQKFCQSRQHSYTQKWREKFL